MLRLRDAWRRELGASQGTAPPRAPLSYPGRRASTRRQRRPATPRAPRSAPGGAARGPGPRGPPVVEPFCRTRARRPRHGRSAPTPLLRSAAPQAQASQPGCSDFTTQGGVTSEHPARRDAPRGPGTAVASGTQGVHETTTAPPPWPGRRARRARRASRLPPRTSDRPRASWASGRSARGRARPRGRCRLHPALRPRLDSGPAARTRPTPTPPRARRLRRSRAGSAPRCRRGRPGRRARGGRGSGGGRRRGASPARRRACRGPPR